MSYLGRSVDAISNVEKLDNITFNGGTTYALTKSSAAFTPAGKNNILISVSGVIQQGNFSVSGSNIVFDSAVASTESCDFIMHYGIGLITTPADDTVAAASIKTDAVTTAKIQNDAVTVDKLNLISTSSVPSLEAKGTSGQTEGYIQLNCAENSHGIKLKSPPHSAGQSYTLTFPSTAPATDKMLQTNSSGVLSFVDAPSGGLVPVAQSSGSSGVDNVIVNNWISDTYENYEMYYAINMASTSADLKMTLYDSSGNLSSGNNYEFGHGGVQSSNGSRQTLYGYDQNSFQISHNTNNDAGRISVTGKMTWLHPRTSGKRTTILNHFRMLDTGVTNRAFFGTLEYKGTEALTGFYMNASSGQIDYYSIKCYGVKNS
jgi:hypothetical protein